MTKKASAGALGKKGKSVAAASSLANSKSKVVLKAAAPAASSKKAKNFFQDSEEDELDWVESGSSGLDEDLDDDFEDEEDDESAREDEDDSDDKEEEDFDSEEFVDDSEMDDEADEEFLESIDQETHESVIAEEDVSGDESLEGSDAEMAMEDLNEDDLQVPVRANHGNNPIMNFFWQLSAESKEERYSAISGLVEHIQSAQCIYQTPAALAITNPERVFSLYDGGALTASCCPDLTYSIKRLIKGLAASRESSRYGFLMALMAVLHGFKSHLNAEVILNWCMKLTSAQSLGGSLKKSEEKFLQMARIFALAALFRSGLGSALSEEGKIASFDALIAAGKKKSFLQEPVLEVLLAIIRSGLSGEESLKLATHVMKRLSALKAFDVESLVLLLVVEKEFSISLSKLEGVLPPFIAADFKNHERILSVDNLPSLLDLLKEVPCHERRLHCIWNEIVLALGDEKTFMSKNEFIRCVIEEHYLNSQGPIKRWTGLMLLKQLFNVFGLEIFENVSSATGVIRMIKGAIGVLNAKSSVLAGPEIAAFNRAVVTFFRGIIDGALKEQPDYAVNIVLAFGQVPSGVPGKSLLDCLVTEDVVSQLYAQFTAKNVNVLLDQMAQSIDVNFDYKSRSLIAFQAPLDRLIALLRNEKLVKLEESSQWIEHLILIFARLAFAQNQLPQPLKDVVLIRFQALLTELSDSKKASHCANWVQKTGSMLVESATGSSKGKKSPKNASLALIIEDEPILDAIGSLGKIGKALKKLEGEGSTNKERLQRAIGLLHEYLTVLVFLDPIETIPVVSELAEAIKSGAVSQSHDELLSVLLEILMTFLAKATHFTRKMCEQVFRLLVPLLSAANLEILFRVLRSRENEAEHGDLFNAPEHEAMVIDNDDEEEEVEEIGDQDLKFSNDEGAISEEEDLNDEQMEAFDAKLAEIFREKKKKVAAADLTATKRSISEFKSKVLELLSIAYRSGDLSLSTRIATIESVLEVLAVNLIQKSGKSKSNASEHRAFSEKLQRFFAEAFGRSSRALGPEDAAVSAGLIKKLIEGVVGGKREDLGHAAILPRLAQSIWFLIKLLRTGEFKNHLKEIDTDSFKKLTEFALHPSEARFRVLRSFLCNWINWDISLVFPHIHTYSSNLKALLSVDALRPFQRGQLFEFLTNALKRGFKCYPAESSQLLACMASSLQDVYAHETLEGPVTKMKIDFFRDDLKFIVFAYRKHREIDSDAAQKAWSPILTTGLRAMDAFWMAQPQPVSNAIKSFLGQLKGLKFD